MDDNITAPPATNIQSDTLRNFFFLYLPHIRGRHNFVRRTLLFPRSSPPLRNARAEQLLFCQAALRRQRVTRRCAWPPCASFQKGTQRKKERRTRSPSHLSSQPDRRCCTVTKGRSRDRTSPRSVTSLPLASPACSVCSPQPSVGLRRAALAVRWRLPLR